MCEFAVGNARSDVSLVSFQLYMECTFRLVFNKAIISEIPRETGKILSILTQYDITTNVNGKFPNFNDGDNEGIWEM